MNFRQSWLAAGAATALVFTGCQTGGNWTAGWEAPRGSLPVQASTDPMPHASAVPAGPLTLEQAVALGLEAHPDLLAAAAAAEAAQGELIQAGLYPNPEIGYAAAQMGDRTGGPGQLGPYVTQEIVTGGKLALDQQAARAALSAAQWQAFTRRFELEARIRIAYYELLSAQREVEERQAIRDISQANLEATQKLEQAGKSTQPDVLWAKVELQSNENRLRAAQTRLEAAWPLLAAAMGRPDLPRIPLAGRLETARPDYELAGLQTAVLANSAELRAAEAAVAQAEAELSRARAENCPNVEFMVNPIYDYAQSVGQINAQIGMRIPAWNRNQGNILAATAELARRQAERERLRLQLIERVVLAHQQLQAADHQADQFEGAILPDALEAWRLTKSAFEGGDQRFDYDILLQSQRTLAQIKLDYLEVLTTAWKAVAEIEALLQKSVTAPAPEPR